MEHTDAKRMQVMDALRNSEQLARQGGLVAGQVMTLAPSSILPETTALELIKLFHFKQFRHLLVTDAQQRLIGVISDRDVIRCLGPERYPNRALLATITAERLMSTDLVTVSPDTPLDRVAVLMVDYGISCLPVVADGKVKGIVTNTDLHVVLQLLLQTLHQSSLEESFAAAVCNLHN